MQLKPFKAILGVFLVLFLCAFTELPDGDVKMSKEEITALKIQLDKINEYTDRLQRENYELKQVLKKEMSRRCA